MEKIRVNRIWARGLLGGRSKRVECGAILPQCISSMKIKATAKIDPRRTGMNATIMRIEMRAVDLAKGIRLKDTAALEEFNLYETKQTQKYHCHLNSNNVQ